ncbi:GNAT family N-acetyltransferase [Streptomyces sp. 7-21]|uniref:GNAT family N-acetyltransferase n=1 Tax=Streptomyces sp. 7-21 TaxID=2802283 RepID=UPI001F3D28C8|nr:GNAT family N-acetyltransferase [Streptomyces sp. 7-21]
MLRFPDVAVESGPESGHGPDVVLRWGGPGDAEGARRLHARCSAQTLRRRYPGPPEEADSYLGHLLDPRHGDVVVAEAEPGELVGMGHLLRDGTEAEVALLVADAWQRRGIGSAMLRWLLRAATAEGYEAVYAVTEDPHEGMAAVMRGTGLPVVWDPAGGTLVMPVGVLVPAGSFATFS